MLNDLQDMNQSKKRKAREESNPGSSKGVISNRFNKEAVIINASAKVKPSCELQLPSMAPLTCKTSSQLFFLRLLRVILQIRDAIKKGLKKGR